MSYRIYIGVGCHDCDLVLDWVREHNIHVEVHDLEAEHTPPPVDVFARPALFVDNDLKAYGVDIISYFEKQQAS